MRNVNKLICASSEHRITTSSVDWYRRQYLGPPQLSVSRKH
jgi:hypothetical protein